MSHPSYIIGNQSVTFVHNDELIKKNNKGKELKFNKTIKGTLVCLGFSMSFAQAFASPQKFEIDIVAADAVTALNSLASQTDFPLLFNFDQMRGFRVDSLKGTYTLQEALDLILRDSGFSGNLMNREVITISPIKPVETQKEEDPMIFKGTKKNLLSSASAVLLAVAATPLTAQAQTAQPEDEVIATGIRQSLKAANDLKRSDTRIVDAIVAEDIGKLPDNNIAEALQRITGVSINTDFGVGDSVSIRGLSQNRVELNGRTTLGDSRDGVSLQDFPSSFLKSVEVIKSPTADMIEGALGGTVRLNTIRPSELKGFTLAGAIDLEYADKTENVAPIGNISVGNVWDLNNGGTFGVIANLAYQDREIRQDEFFNRVINVEGPSNLTSPTPSGAFQLRDQPTLQQFVEERERAAFTGTLEYVTASEKGRFYLDTSFTDRSGQQAGNSILDVAGGPIFDANTTVDEYGQLNNLIIGPAFVIPKTWSNFRETESFSHAIGGDWEVTDKITIAVEASIAESETDRVVSELNLRPIDNDLFDARFEGFGPQTDLNGVAFGAAGWIPTYGTTADPTLNHQPTTEFGGSNMFDEGSIRAGVTQHFFQVDDRLPSITYDDGQALLNPDTLAIRALILDLEETKNEETAFKADVTYENPFGLDYVKSFNFGGRYASNDFVFEQNKFSTGNFYSNNFSGNAEDGTLQPFILHIDEWEALFPGSTEIVTHENSFDQLGLSGPNQLLSYLVTRGDDLADQELTFERFQQAFAGTNIASTGTLEENQVLDEGSFIDVQEDTFALYASADFEFDRIQGNVGVRYIDTDIESGSVNDPTVNHSYDDWLPSINLSYDINDNTKARFAAAKVMRRADYSALSSAFSVDSFFTVASSGDPTLEPFRATQYDVSVEHYFDNGGLISVAGFYKDVESFLSSETTCTADSRTLGGGQNTTEFGNICLLGVNGGTEDNLAFLIAADFQTGSSVLAGLPNVGTSIAGNADEIRAASLLPGYDANDAGTNYFAELAAAGNTGILTDRITNGENGEVYGAEVALQYQLDFLPGVWSGFGFNGNYTWAESSQPDGNSLLDISKHTLNAQLYWENETFQARLAYNYRSRFLDTQLERRINRIGELADETADDPTIGNNYREGRGQFDFSTSYDVTPQLTLVGTATNLTGEPSIFSTELGSNWQYREADRRFAIGARFTY